MRARPFLFLALTASLPFVLGQALGACASEVDGGADDASADATSTSTSTGPADANAPPRDGATTTDGAVQQDSSSDAAGLDAAACVDSGATTVFGPGDTCAVFGEGTPCGGGCLPTYGYVCTNGGPPNVASCVRARESSLGGTYCCPTLECARSSFEDTKCAGKPGKTKMYSCPVDASQNLRAQPPGGVGACEEVAGPAYRYFCCP